MPNETPWWRKKADEMFFVEDYNEQDMFRAGIDALVIESARLERERCIKAIQDNHHCAFNDGFDCECKLQAIKEINL